MASAYRDAVVVLSLTLTIPFIPAGPGSDELLYLREEEEEEEGA